MILFSFFIFAALSCSDDSRVNSEDIPKLTQAIYFIPSAYFGASYQLFTPTRTKIIEQGETAHLVAGLKLNGEALSSDYISDYALNVIWNINGKKYIAEELSATFSDTGNVDIILNTIDFFLDTLRDTLSLMIDAPLQIEQISPADNYNQFDPFDSLGITFSIQTEGIDSWESPVCLLYASHTKEAIWSSFIDTIPCNGNLQIKGPFTKLDSSDLEDSTLTYYWAAKAKISNSNATYDRDSTQIFTFQTKLTTAKSHLAVPIHFKSLSSARSPKGLISLVDLSGDTLKTDSITQADTIFHFSRITAGDSLQVLLSDATLPEYGTKKISFYLAKASYTTLDTIVLEDKTSPLRFPASSAVASTDSIRFYFYDAGSGTAISSAKVIIDSDTLSYNYTGDIISFKPLCSSTCKLQVSAKDFAGNATSSIFWKLKKGTDTLFIQGPYSEDGE